MNHLCGPVGSFHLLYAESAIFVPMMLRFPVSDILFVAMIAGLSLAGWLFVELVSRLKGD